MRDFAADVVAADPGERAGLFVGVLGVLDEEMLGGGFDRVALRDNGIFATELGRHGAAVRHLPRLEHRGGIVGDVLDVAAAFEDEGFEAVLAEFFGGPTAGHAGADDDGVVGVGDFAEGNGRGGEALFGGRRGRRKRGDGGGHGGGSSKDQGPISREFSMPEGQSG